MKQIQSNALRQQLARPPNPGPHPDADLLTAFTENTLLERERVHVLAHLSACQACREILQAVGAASEPEPAMIPQEAARPTRPPLRTWLPGVVIAVCVIAVAGSGVLFYHATKANQPDHQTASTAAPPVTAVPQPRVTPAPAREAGWSAKHAAPPARVKQPAPAAAKAAIPAPIIETEEAKVLKPTAPEAPPPGAIAGGASEETRAKEPEHAEVSEQNRSPPQSRVATDKARKAARIESQPAFAERAPAREQTMGGLMARPGTSLRWRIGDDGRIERAAGEGAWEPVLTGPNRFRVLSVSGTEIWAGGDQLQLFRSRDNGRTWIPVALPISADRTHAIAHIRFETALTIRIEADDGTAWTTSNGGKTWR